MVWYHLKAGKLCGFCVLALLCFALLCFALVSYRGAEMCCCRSNVGIGEGGKRVAGAGGRGEVCRL